VALTGIKVRRSTELAGAAMGFSGW
jgi:hypothetical protein